MAQVADTNRPTDNSVCTNSLGHALYGELQTNINIKGTTQMVVLKVCCSHAVLMASLMKNTLVVDS